MGHDLTRPLAPATLRASSLSPSEQRTLASLASEARARGRIDPLPAPVLAAYEGRRAAHVASLRPATEREIAAILYTLSRMPAPSAVDEDDAEIAVGIALNDLAGLPAWALKDAAEAFRTGRLGDGHWRPTSGDLRKAAERLTAPAHAEVRQLADVLAAPIAAPPNPDKEVERAKRRLAGDMLRRAAEAACERDRDAERRRTGKADEPQGHKVETRSVQGMPEGPERDAVLAAHAKRLEDLAASSRRRRS